jgi:hypothetical protein
MTQLLEEVLEHVKQLPETDQDAIAALILEELDQEKRWDAAFARSHDLLAKLAAEAEQEDRAGLTRELNAHTL